MAIDSADPRTYQLLIEVTGSLRLRVGRLGVFDFPAGVYLYTGSALRNFEARVRRHLAASKKLRWHIDYLLSAPGVRVIDVLRHTDAECEVSRRVDGEVVVPGFGASDCRAGCGSHLKRIVCKGNGARKASEIAESKKQAVVRSVLDCARDTGRCSCQASPK